MWSLKVLVAELFWWTAFHQAIFDVFFPRWTNFNDGSSLLFHKSISITGFYLIRLFIELMKFNFFVNGRRIVYIYIGPSAPELLIYLAVNLFSFILDESLYFILVLFTLHLKNKNIYFLWQVQKSRPTMFAYL